MIAFNRHIFAAAGVAVLLTVASVVAPTAGAATTTPAAGGPQQYGWWGGAGTAYGGYGYYGLPTAGATVGGDDVRLLSGAYPQSEFYVPFYGYGGLDYQNANYPGSGTAAFYHVHVPYGGLAYPPYPYAGAYVNPFGTTATYYPSGVPFAPVYIR